MIPLTPCSGLPIGQPEEPVRRPKGVHRSLRAGAPHVTALAAVRAETGEEGTSHCQESRASRAHRPSRRHPQAGEAAATHGSASHAEQRPGLIRLPACEAGGRLVSPTATVTATTAAVSALTQPQTAGYSRTSSLGWASATPEKRTVAQPRRNNRPSGRPLRTHPPKVRDTQPVAVPPLCKTVGSAYVGSNPTPATTSHDGSELGKSGSGPLLPCAAVRLRVPACGRGVHHGIRVPGAINRERRRGRTPQGTFRRTPGGWAPRFIGRLIDERWIEFVR